MTATEAPDNEVPSLPCDQKTVLFRVMPEVPDRLSVTRAASENVAQDCPGQSNSQFHEEGIVGISPLERAKGTIGNDRGCESAMPSISLPLSSI